MRRVDRINRIGLSVLALLFVAAGAASLARGYGAFGPEDARATLIDPLWRKFVRENNEWFWPAVVGICLLLAWIFQRWLRAQIPDSHPAGGIDLVATGTRGLTQVRAAAIGHAVADDLRSYERVQDVEARIVVRRPSPRLELQITVDDDTDLDTLRAQIDAHALKRLRQALDVASVDTVVLFHYGSPFRVVR